MRIYKYSMRFIVHVPALDQSDCSICYNYDLIILMYSTLSVCVCFSILSIYECTPVCPLNGCIFLGFLNGQCVVGDIVMSS